MNTPITGGGWAGGAAVSGSATRTLAVTGVSLPSGNRVRLTAASHGMEYNDLFDLTGTGMTNVDGTLLRVDDVVDSNTVDFVAAAVPSGTFDGSATITTGNNRGRLHVGANVNGFDVALSYYVDNRSMHHELLVDSGVQVRCNDFADAKDDLLTFPVASATYAGTTLTVTLSIGARLKAAPEANNIDNMFLDLPGITGLAATTARRVETVNNPGGASTVLTFTISGLGGAYTSGGIARLDWANHGLGGYVHPNVAVRLNDSTLLDAPREAFKHYSQSAITQEADFFKADGLHIRNPVGPGLATSSTQSATGLPNRPTHISNSVIEANVPLIVRNDVLLDNVDLFPLKGSAAITGDVASMEAGTTYGIKANKVRVHPPPPNTTDLVQNLINLGARANGVYEFTDCDFWYAWDSVLFNGSSATGARIKFSGCNFYGPRANANFPMLSTGLDQIITFEGCRFEGSGAVLQGGAVPKLVTINDCSFFGTLVRLFNSNSPNNLSGKVVGRNNYFDNNTNYVFNYGGTAGNGVTIQPKEGISPTAIASAAAISAVSPNFSTHRVSGAATIGTLRFGTDNGQGGNRCLHGAIIRLIADTGATWTLNGADFAEVTGPVVAGQVVTLMYDASVDKFRKV